MKIAIASVEKSEDSQISTRGGRAPYYLIFNEKKELLEVISNPFTSGGGGAGTGTAKMLADINVDIVIVGEVGEKMKELLDEKGLKILKREGVVKEALIEAING